MNTYTAMLLVIVALFALMAYRAFRSGTTTDYLLGAAQCVGLLFLLTNYRQPGLYLLLITALAYLLSQFLTGARPISRLLPVVGAFAIVLYLMI